jgi:hypothetical protein
MHDLLRDLKSAGWPSLAALVSGAAGTVWALQAGNTETVAISRATGRWILTCVASAFVGLGSWALRLWLRDLKRARIRFAKEQGRRICTCTQTGEIFIADPQRYSANEKIEVCPACHREIKVQT